MRSWHGESTEQPAANGKDIATDTVYRGALSPNEHSLPWMVEYGMVWVESVVCRRMPANWQFLG
jgi:hypothetical protein